MSRQDLKKPCYQALVICEPTSESKLVSLIGNKEKLNRNHSYIKFGRRDSKQRNALCGWPERVMVSRGQWWGCGVRRYTVSPSTWCWGAAWLDYTSEHDLLPTAFVRSLYKPHRVGFSCWFCPGLLSDTWDTDCHPVGTLTKGLIV